MKTDMKRFFFTMAFVIAGTLLGLVITEALQPQPTAVQPPVKPLDVKQCLIDDVSAIAVTRVARSEANRRVGSYIEAELTKLGLQVERQPFSTGVNIIGTQKGTTGRTFVVGSHYDSVSTTPGADDNASGCAMTLSLARRLNKTPTKHTIRYIFFDNEESGMIGSSYYVRTLRDQCDFMVNSDMVGTLNTSSDGPGTLFSQLFKQYPWARSISSRDAYGGSDHNPFTRRGIPNVFIHTGLHNRYHGPGDKPDTLNYDGMVKISDYLVELVTLFDSRLDAPQIDRLVKSLPECKVQQ